MLRQRFATTQEVVYPNANRYWTIWSFWNQNVSPARAINEAMNPEKVSDYTLYFLWYGSDSEAGLQ